MSLEFEITSQHSHRSALRPAVARIVAVVAFKRWSGNEEAIIVASFNNTAFASGYVIEKDMLPIPNSRWKEIFNSDAAI